MHPKRPTCRAIASTLASAAVEALATAGFQVERTGTYRKYFTPRRVGGAPLITRKRTGNPEKPAKTSLEIIRHRCHPKALGKPGNNLDCGGKRSARPPWTGTAVIASSEGAVAATATLCQRSPRHQTTGHPASVSDSHNPWRPPPSNHKSVKKAQLVAPKPWRRRKSKFYQVPSGSKMSLPKPFISRGQPPAGHYEATPADHWSSAKNPAEIDHNKVEQARTNPKNAKESRIPHPVSLVASSPWRRRMYPTRPTYSQFPLVD